MLNKKNCQTLLIVVMICFFVGGTVFSAEKSELHFPIDVTGFSAQDLSEIKIIVNGKTVQTDVNPEVRDGRLLIPLRAVFAELGAEVHWFEDVRTVAMMDKEKDIRIIVQLGNNTVFGSRMHWEFEQNPILHGNRTLVMPEVIALGYDVEVEWNKSAKELKINTK